eukprot:Clim_evm13s234 gene=Clim_evmTU13s234
MKKDTLRLQSLTFRAAEPVHSGSTLARVCQALRDKNLRVEDEEEYSFPEKPGEANSDKFAYLFETFQGKQYEQAVSIGCRVLGPMAVLSCIRQSCDLPSETPLWSLSMTGTVVSLTGFKKGPREELKERVKFMNGTVSPELNTTVTNLVASGPGSEKYYVAVENRIPVMTRYWVDETWRQGGIEPISATMEPFAEKYQMKVFQGAHISTSGLTKDERSQIEAQCLAHGGTFNLALDTVNATHLLCHIPEGPKFMFAAKAPNIKVVTPLWFRKSLEAGGQLREDKFPVTDMHGKIHKALMTVNLQLKDFERLVQLASENSENAILTDCKFMISGFETPQTACLKDIVHSLGGRTGPQPTHVIIGKYPFPEQDVISKMEDLPYILTAGWIKRVVEKGRVEYLSGDRIDHLVFGRTHKPLNSSTRNGSTKRSSSSSLGRAAAMFATAKPKISSAKTGTLVNDSVADESLVLGGDRSGGKVFEGMGFVFDSNCNRWPFKDKLKAAGGTIVLDGDHATFRVMSLFVGAETDAESQSLTFCTTLWVERCIQSGQLLALEENPLYVPRRKSSLWASMSIAVDNLDGKLSAYIQEIIEGLGGTMTSVVTKSKTKLLITEDKMGMTIRVVRANEVNIPLLSINELMGLIKERCEPYSRISSDAASGGTSSWLHGGVSHPGSTSGPCDVHPTDMESLVSDKLAKAASKATARQALKKGYDVDETSNDIVSDGRAPLNNLVILIAKRLAKKADDVRELAQLLGARVARRTNEAGITHLVDSDNEKGKPSELPLAKRRGLFVVAPEWLIACQETGKRVDEGSYPSSLNPRKALNIMSSAAQPENAADDLNAQQAISSDFDIPSHIQDLDGGQAALHLEDDELPRGPVVDTARDVGVDETSNTPAPKRSGRLQAEAITAIPAVSKRRRLMHSLMDAEANDKPLNVRESRRRAPYTRAVAQAFSSDHGESDHITYGENVEEDDEAPGATILAMGDSTANGKASGSLADSDSASLTINTRTRSGAAAAGGTIRGLRGRRRPVFQISQVDDKDKDQYILVLKQLGAEVINAASLSTECTHLIMKDLKRNEKLCSAVAAGVWIMMPSYIKACLNVGRLVDEQDYEWSLKYANINSTPEAKEHLGAPPYWRERLQNERAKAMADHDGEVPRIGAFQSWRVVLNCDNYNQIFKRILVCGGAEVSLWSQIARTDGDDELKRATHLFVANANSFNDEDWSLVERLGIQGRVYTNSYISDFLFKRNIDISAYVLRNPVPSRKLKGAGGAKQESSKVAEQTAAPARVTRSRSRKNHAKK